MDIYKEDCRIVQVSGNIISKVSVGWITSLSRSGMIHVDQQLCLYLLWVLPNLKVYFFFKFSNNMSKATTGWHTSICKSNEELIRLHGSYYFFLLWGIPIKRVNVRNVWKLWAFSRKITKLYRLDILKSAGVVYDMFEIYVLCLYFICICLISFVLGLLYLFWY